MIQVQGSRLTPLIGEGWVVSLAAAAAASPASPAFLFLLAGLAGLAGWRRWLGWRRSSRDAARVTIHTSPAHRVQIHRRGYPFTPLGWRDARHNPRIIGLE